MAAFYSYIIPVSLSYLLMHMAQT